MISFGNAASSHSGLIPLKTVYKKRGELLWTIASKTNFINLHSFLWQSETSHNQGIPNQVPWLGLVSRFQIWDFCGYSLNTLKLISKNGNPLFFPVRWDKVLRSSEMKVEWLYLFLSVTHTLNFSCSSLLAVYFRFLAIQIGSFVCEIRSENFEVDQFDFQPVLCCVNKMVLTWKHT